ncbi:MAG: methylglyoxal synthase [Selenomonadaceae bacterium]|nr:methylglyoxal synthase [Selenomonadaceae bacterium]
MLTIALIAHDKKKNEMLEFVGHHKELLANFHLVATRTTGTLIRDTFGLDVETMMSGPLGGDQQIGALVATEQVQCVIFLRDPLTSQPHEPDINALLRLCDVHNIPLATNRKSAHILLKYVAEKGADEGKTTKS